MPLKITKFDVVDHLKTERDIQGYLNACLEDGDPQTIAAAFGHAARARGAMSKIAKASGVSRSNLYKSLSKDGNPGIGTVVKAAKSLGYKMTVVKAEPLEKPAKKTVARRASA